MDMPKYIMSILQSQPAIVWSWGAHGWARCRMQEKEGLRFSVQGFKYKGDVAVLYDEGADVFDVVLLDRQPLRTVSPVYFDELVDRIDELVERVADYAARVDAWLDAPTENPDEDMAKTIGQYLRKARQQGDLPDVIVIE